MRVPQDARKELAFRELLRSDPMLARKYEILNADSSSLRSMEPVSLRPAVEADIPFLVELRRQTMSRHQLASGLTPSEEERMRRVLAQFDCARVILQAGEPVGLLKVRREGQAWELVQIQLLPSLQGLGVGTRLLQALVQEAREAGAGLKLSVLKANPARRLYERMGFVVVREKANAYEMALGA